MLIAEKWANLNISPENNPWLSGDFCDILCVVWETSIITTLEDMQAFS